MLSRFSVSGKSWILDSGTPKSGRLLCVMKEGMWIIICQRLILEALFDIVYWPVWWYTGGVVYAGKKAYTLFQFGNEWLAPGVWLHNLFVPMYGQYDWTGRMISFVMRLINIIGRGIALCIWIAVCAVVPIVWVVLPVFIVRNIMRGL